MSDWQKILRDDSISTLDELKAWVAERFGAVRDPPAARQAASRGQGVGTGAVHQASTASSARA